MTPQVITRDPAAAPLDIELGASDSLTPQAAFAHFNGSGAAGSFLPAITYYTQDGKVFARAVAPTAVAAGASADVSWFPGLVEGTSTSSGGTGFEQVFVDTPDGSGNAFAGASLSNGFANMRRLVPYFAHAGDGYWTATIRVPPNYTGSPVVTLTGVVNANTGAVRLIVGTAVVAAGSSEDVAFTDETAQTITVPGTALVRFDTAFAIAGTTPAAGADLMVRVKRNAANAADTCTASYGLWACAFTYAT